MLVATGGDVAIGSKRVGHAQGSSTIDLYGHHHPAGAHRTVAASAQRTRVRVMAFGPAESVTTM